MANRLKEKKQRHHGLTYLYLFLLFQLLPYAAAQNSNNQAPPSDSNGYGYGYGYGFSANFSPAMVIILVVIISFFFFLGFFSIYIRSCTGRNGNGGSIRPAFLGGGMSRRANRGLDPAVIATFPTFEYSVVKGLKLGKGALECAVCLNEFEDDETIRLLPKCDHAFHPDCIDVWLSNRTTCPVCRANLVPEPGETSANTDLEDESEGEIRESEIVDEEEIREVSIHVISEEEPVREVAVAVAVAAPEVINLVQAPMPNRPTRSRSTRPRNAGRFPRSHSTGHSLVQPGEDIERFTLRLPEELRKQIMNQRLNRTRSMVVFPRAGSTRRGYRMTGEGSSRGGRFTRMEMAEKPEGWVFSKTPPFFMRASSARLPQMSAEADSTVTPAPLPPLPPKPFRSSLRGSTKSDGSGHSLTRPSV